MFVFNVVGDNVITLPVPVADNSGYYIVILCSRKNWRDKTYWQFSYLDLYLEEKSLVNNSKWILTIL